MNASGKIKIVAAGGGVAAEGLDWQRVWQRD
jgi:hypothetical protein